MREASSRSMPAPARLPCVAPLETAWIIRRKGRWAIPNCHPAFTAPKTACATGNAAISSPIFGCAAAMQGQSGQHWPPAFGLSQNGYG
eukprot:9009083-Prorocentrum_lima.AAC.1